MKEYPKHCIGCRKEQECSQKFFMTANTEPIDGYINFDAAEYVCWDCLNELDNYDSLDYPETDSPIHCSYCGRPLNCRLTADGLEYVKELLAGSGGCCRELWPKLFEEYL